jgi:monofunctional biosynthetic peptidoglycan transglycosylase
MTRNLSLMPLSALTGLLLMTSSGPTHTATHSDRLITDFTPDSADLGWYVVNDNVMGGRSSGDFDLQDGELHFAGSTNTQGGGFSSIRTGDLELDLSQYAGLRLQVKGDGRRYTWRLATDAVWNGRPVSYWAEFDTVKDTWTTVDIPFASFVPRFRGYELPGPELDNGQITGMGLMIYDRQDGPFNLQLGSVSVYAIEAA